MRRAFPAVALLLSFALGAAEPPAPSPQEIERAVSDLGSPDFELREAAYRRLLEWGMADPDRILKEIPREDPDPERRQMCGSLLALIPRERLRRDALSEAGDDGALREAIESLFAAPSKESLAKVATAAARHPERARLALASFYRDASPALREASIAITGRLRVPGAAPLLVPLLAEGPPEARHAIAEALLSLGDRSIVPALEAMLSRDEALAREGAVLVLGRLAPPGEASSRFVALLADGDAAVRSAAARVILHRKDPAAVAPISALLADPRPVARALATHVLSRHPGGDPARIPPLLSDRMSEVRLAAVEALAHLRHLPSGSAVAKLLADPDSQVRAAAAGAMGILGQEGRAADLASLLKDPSAAVRAGALRSLSMMKASSFSKEAAALLADADPEVRRAAVGALCQMGVDAHAEDVAKLLRDDKAEVVATAIAATAELFDRPEAVRRIAPLLEHADLTVKVVATQVLATLTGNRWDPSGDGSLQAHAWWERHRNDPEYRKPK